VTPAIAYDLVSVDRALEWGYAWDVGPYKQMDLLGLDWLKSGFARSGLDAPPLLVKAQGSFYKDGAAGDEYLTNDGGYAPVPPVPGSLDLSALRRRGSTLDHTADATLHDLGDGVAGLEFHSKMNSLGEGVLRMLDKALDRVAREGMAGLVIGNEDPRTFTAGADLMMVARLAQSADWSAADQAVGFFQQCSMRIRQAPFPVVAAPFGLTLGGGCEFSLHAALVQAHAELYMGLVEVGVGIIPAGGGTKELLFRFTQALEPYEEADPFEAVKRAFKLIATAQTSTSALEARRLGFLRAVDRISMNRDRLLADARQRVLDLAPDYVAPVPRTIRALGKAGLGNLDYALFSFREAGQASAHDVLIGRKLAYVLCGGDGPSRIVTEQDILDLEREAFLSLLGTKVTQERISAMLKTGKPLRN